MSYLPRALRTEEGRQSGRRSVAEMYRERADEYRRYADTLREAVLRSFEPADLDSEPGGD